jgi:formylglycine-generating enzyme required for sulfatase activity
MGDASSDEGPKPADPVTWLTIAQAAAYCEWIDRRLPTAAEWELAAKQFAQTAQNPRGFVFTDVWEWTSSYQAGDSHGIRNVWNGQPQELRFDWTFIHQGALRNSDSPVVDTYKNTSGALGASADLGFRCAQR